MRPPVRRLRRRRPPRRVPRVLAALAILGPGLLAGLSDDDPAGITTYSVLGTEHGYRLLWVLAVSVAALVVFHEIGARLGLASGSGLGVLVRERYGRRWALAGLAVLLPANLGTCCAELAGISAALAPFGIPPWVAAPLAALLVTSLMFAGSFHRVEHVLLALSAVFVAYVGACLLARPDWGAAARGLVTPSVPAGGAAIAIVVATVGTTLAPWGLAFIQSAVADKRVGREHLRLERLDVISGALLTGIIGGCVVIACAATLHAQGRGIDDAGDAARALEPVAGAGASVLFSVGLLGAGLLAAAVVPLATAYSVCETVGAEARLDDDWRAAPLFHRTYVATAAFAAAVVSIPGVPLLGILVGSQTLNAVLLCPMLLAMRRLACDERVMGDLRLGRTGRVLSAATIALVLVCVVALFAVGAVG
jgi:Mn2+/Fe2+ NRAMP family transporter